MKHMMGRSSSGLFLLMVASVLGCVATAAAQPAANEISPRERTALAESYVTERLWVWQKRLNLQDWRISVIMSRATELKPRTLGNIHWDLEKKSAVIRVLDPADYKLPQREMLQDMEFTVVHELIHLGLAPVLADLQRSDANRRDEEHTVNSMAEALLRLDRRP
jgi:hypothetical protein